MRLNSKVLVTVNEKKWFYGKLVGYGMCVRNDVLTPLYIVELNEGYYDPNGGWVCLVCVHPDAITGLPSGFREET
jgi:hypothetical protein